MEAMNLKRVKPKINKGDMFFYCVFLAWPVLQFAIFYIGVNFNSVLMSFKEFDQTTNTIKFGWGSYKWVFEFMGTSTFKGYLGVTIKGFLISSIISTPLGLLFAYYIYKKLFGWGAFRVILFLPQIVSAVVIALMFRWFVNDYIPALFPSVGNLFDTGRFEKTSFPMLMFFAIWIGFGTTVLMYSNKMSSISEEIIESAHLDGATGLKEFWYIVLPLTFSTFSVFLITSVSQLFINQFGAYELYRGQTSQAFRSIGYYFFLEVRTLSAHALDPTQTPSFFKFAALGIVLTIITVPLALGIRWAVEKYGPSEE